MALTDPIKTYLNVNNRWLATYIGISVDQMESVRMGRRMLEVDQMLDFQQIIDALDQEVPVDQLVHTPTITEHEKIDLEKAIRKLSNALARCRERLQATQEKRAHAIRGLHACKILMDVESLSPHQYKWIAMVERDLKRRLERYSLQRIVELRGEVLGMEQRLGVFEKGWWVTDGFNIRRNTMRGSWTFFMRFERNRS